MHISIVLLLLLIDFSSIVFRPVSSSCSINIYLSWNLMTKHYTFFQHKLAFLLAKYKVCLFTTL
jgi:hypothetical protein